MSEPEDPRLRLAYEEGFRALDIQREDLERLRTRVVALASVASIAAGVLGGFTGRSASTHRSVWLYIGLVAFGILIVCVCIVLAPHKTYFETEPRDILDYYVDGGYDANETLRWSAHYAGVNADTNRKRLELLSWVYLGAIIAMGVVIAAFALLLTGKG